MKYRPLGNTGLEVSEIGFGGWAMGKLFWGDDVVDDDSLAAVQQALESGINFFDTAPVYGAGHSETLLGKALAGRRDEVVIATKCGRLRSADGVITNDSSPASVRAECEVSLRRLQTDVIDLYQVHWPDEQTPFEDTMAALMELRDEGKIRAIGVSNFAVDMMQRMMAAGELSATQPPYSLLRRDIESEVLPFCRQHDLAVLAYSPMQRGLLTGKYGSDARFPATDTRSRDPLFQGETLARIVSAVQQMTALAAAHGKTAGQLAVAWVLNQPGVTVALCGAKRPHHIAESAGAAGWQLETDLQQQLAGLFAGLA
jgi:aryl-alcohol dehydrogenase-like predicted oxidoreductase